VPRLALAFILRVSPSSVFESAGITPAEWIWAIPELANAAGIGI